MASYRAPSKRILMLRDEAKEISFGTTGRRGCPMTQANVIYESLLQSMIGDRIGPFMGHNH